MIVTYLNVIAQLLLIGGQPSWLTEIELHQFVELIHELVQEQALSAGVVLLERSSGCEAGPIQKLNSCQIQFVPDQECLGRLSHQELLPSELEKGS